jgi:hypothetical protein
MRATKQQWMYDLTNTARIISILGMVIVVCN